MAATGMPRSHNLKSNRYKQQAKLAGHELAALAAAVVITALFAGALAGSALAARTSQKTHSGNTLIKSRVSGNVKFDCRNAARP